MSTKSSLSVENEWTGRPNPSCENKFSGAKGYRGKNGFPVQLTRAGLATAHKQEWQTHSVDPCPAMYACMCGQTYSKNVDQPGKVPNPVRGQLNREN